MRMRMMVSLMANLKFSSWIFEWRLMLEISVGNILPEEGDGDRWWEVKMWWPPKHPSVRWILWRWQPNTLGVPFWYAGCCIVSISWDIKPYFGFDENLWYFMTVVDSQTGPYVLQSIWCRCQQFFVLSHMILIHSTENVLLYLIRTCTTAVGVFKKKSLSVFI